MVNAVVRDRVFRLFRLSAELNELRQLLAAEGESVQFFLHPETRNIGIRLSSDLADIAHEAAEDNASWSVETVTEN